MDIVSLFSNLVYSSVPIVLAITLREATRSWMAKKLGDTTAYREGRVTLDPLNHVDLNGTIIFPLVMFVITQGTFLFGWAKPLNINENAFKNYKRDNIILALTGPATNFMLAIVWLISFYLLQAINSTLPLVEGLTIMSKFGIFINLTYMAFTLLPLLPLDGGKIVKVLLPLKYSTTYAKLEPYGVIIIVLLAILGITGLFTTPIVNGATQLLLNTF